MRRPRAPEIPHQQLDQTAPALLQEQLRRRMIALDGVRAGRSGISLPQTRALHLDPELALGLASAFMVGVEFAHLHGASDGSLHVALPPDVAAVAITRGWAEAHSLARRGIIPATHLMIYGPRDEAELETVWRLLEISYEYARGKRSLAVGRRRPRSSVLRAGCCGWRGTARCPPMLVTPGRSEQRPGQDRCRARTVRQQAAAPPPRMHPQPP